MRRKPRKSRGTMFAEPAKMRTWIAGLLLLGCSSSPAPAPALGPLFYEDVEPILQAKCTACHYEGGVGGFAMDAHSATVRALLIADNVRSHTMPPWPPGPLGPPIHNARILADREIETIGTWADHGAPLGDPAHHVDRPPMITFDPGRAPDVRLVRSRCTMPAECAAARPWLISDAIRMTSGLRRGAHGFRSDRQTRRPPKPGRSSSWVACRDRPRDRC